MTFFDASAMWAAASAALGPGCPKACDRKVCPLATAARPAAS
jgi:hypothetical protein